MLYILKKISTPKKKHVKEPIIVLVTEVSWLFLLLLFIIAHYERDKFTMLT